jgi:hypothetical protein
LRESKLNATERCNSWEDKCNLKSHMIKLCIRQMSKDLREK